MVDEDSLHWMSLCSRIEENKLPLSGCDFIVLVVIDVELPVVVTIAVAFEQFVTGFVARTFAIIVDIIVAIAMNESRALIVRSNCGTTIIQNESGTGRRCRVFICV
jgi:hypothetical protein